MQTELEFLRKWSALLAEVRQTEKYSEQMMCIVEAHNAVVDRLAELKGAELTHQGLWTSCPLCIEKNIMFDEHKEEYSAED